MERADVVIIGGGAAGLSSAAALAGRGLRILLLEGRDRLGGRILTRRYSHLPLPLELGAEFIHGEAPSTLELCDSSALLVDELPDDHARVTSRGLEPLADFWGEIARVRRRISGTRDRSFAQFLHAQKSLPPRTRKLATGFVQGYHAADPEQISALALSAGDEETDDDEDAVRQFRIVAGYDALVDALRVRVGRSAGVRLGVTVRTIERRESDLVIRGSGPTSHELEPIRCRAAIISVPIPLLRQRAGVASLAIDPPIEELSKAVSMIEAGHVAKIILRFRERFWDDRTWIAERSATRAGRLAPLHFLHADDEPIPTWWTPAPARAPVITGWAGGPPAVRLLAGGPAAAIESALDVLARIVSENRRRLASLLEGADLHDWSSDPFSLGAYSYVRVGGLPAQKRLSRPFDGGRILLAGEATDTDETGTVSGAISSGRRAAEQALAYLDG